MAIDEALLIWHSEQKIPPTLRFYGWKKPSLTIGHFQNAEKSIDFSGVTKYDCDFVRRLTGGSAVLHDDEITYSIIVSETHPKIPASVKDRKSTRLNSSHVAISYAVFCLKKKKPKTKLTSHLSPYR